MSANISKKSNGGRLSVEHTITSIYLFTSDYRSEGQFNGNTVLSEHDTKDLVVTDASMFPPL